MEYDTKIMTNHSVKKVNSLFRSTYYIIFDVFSHFLLEKPKGAYVYGFMKYVIIHKTLS